MNDNRILVRHHGSKYTPHQSKGERRRRLRQIAAGTLKGNEGFIPIGTRYAAIGLTDPTEIYLLKEPKNG